MSNILTISGKDLLISFPEFPEINEGRPLCIGQIEGVLFRREENFNNLLKKYCAWTIYEDILSVAENIEFYVKEENGTHEPDTFRFSITKQEIIAKNPRIIKDPINKLILPLSWFKVETNDDFSKKRIQQLGIEWFIKLRAEFHKDYMKNLSKTLQKERLEHIIYPASPDVFRALRITPFSTINVVAIGQNPYHNGLADGLAFSSLNEAVIPKSLENIFKEIENDVYNGLMLERDPRLDRWAKQGVLLTNTSLTVREGEAESHFNIGWETFTSEIISALYRTNRPIVWFLWGNQAQQSFDEVMGKYGQINERHLVLRAAHPSPKSVDKGFFGCKHFSRCNKFLESNGLKGISW